MKQHGSSATAHKAPPDTLVLVEDHLELAEYLAGRLREHAPVLVFSDAESALIHLQQQGACVLISDIRLPGMSGIELCKEVTGNAHNSAVPVILMSAFSSDATRQAALEAGAKALLVKPFGFEVLLKAIAAACDPPASAASLEHYEPR